MTEYVPILNTTNLEARLAKAIIANEALLKKASDTKEKEKKPKKKFNRRRIIHNICLALLIILAISIGGITMLNASQQNELKEISKLQDARLISYENQIYEVKKLALLFAIYDDESYQRAKLNNNLSSELYSTYFVNEHYNKSEAPIEIEYQDVLYEITENDYVTYVLYFKRIQGDVIKQYIVQAEFTGNTCIYFGVLN